VSGFEPLTCRLQEVRPPAPRTLAAQMTRVIALMAFAALGLSGTPVHEPVHVERQGYPMTVTQRSSRGSSFAPAAVAASATLCTVKSGSMAGRGPGRWRTGTHRSAARRRRRPAEPGSRLGISRSGCRCLGRWPASDPVGLGVLTDTLSAADHVVEGNVDQAPVEVDVSEQPMPGAAACSCVRPGGAPGGRQRPAEQVVPAVAGRTRRVPTM
jgi:hypothetical protein